ncbi:MAG: FecR domain-containing protein [Acidobacteriota bacterium]|nr:FecR family protein [Blastocatellia bacterium]MDW8411413.1 FecR domain-containing protein [Acidobacteriota bacterium]
MRKRGGLTLDWFVISKKTINRVIFSIIAFILLIIGGYFAKLYIEQRLKDQPISSSARLLRVEGRVTIKKHSSGATENATTSTILEPEDTIQTGTDSYAVIQYEDGSIYNIKPGSTIIFKENTANSTERRVANQVTTGTVSIRTSAESGTHIVTLPHSSANINKDSDTTLSSNGEKDSIQVLQGSVKVSTATGIEIVTSDEYLAVAKEGTTRSKLPPAPRIKNPQNGAQFLLPQNDTAIELSWEPIEGVDHYKVMVSAALTFPPQALSLNRDGIVDTKIKWVNPAEGNYYWRVQGITKDGIEGRWSDTPAFLVKIQRQGGKELPLRITKTNEINFFLVEVEGITKPGAFVKINDRPQIQADSKGFFKADVSFPPGTRSRTLVIEAIDNNGNKGNLTQIL